MAEAYANERLSEMCRVTIVAGNYQFGFRAIESMSAVGQALENLLEEPALKELEKARR